MGSTKKKKKEETEMTLTAAEGRLPYGACMQVCAFDPFTLSVIIIIIIICDQFCDKERRKEEKKTSSLIDDESDGWAIVTFCLLFSF